MPIVTGLFSNLDLRVGEPPQVVVQTRTYATSQTARQLAAVVLAIALVCGALLALARVDRRRRPSRSVRGAFQSAWRFRDPTDLVVVCALLVWWIVAPTFTDDGWVWVEHRAFDFLGTNGLYYDTWGINSPIGHWFEWLRHWGDGSTNDLVFMRLPTLLIILASWPLCRWCLHKVVRGRPTPGVRWTLAGAFLVGATAWAMTLRPEPFISLLTLVGLAAMASFVRAPRLAPLAIAVPAAVLGATAHPAGLVAAAPLLAAGPEAIGWLRSGGRQLLFALGALLLVGLALTVVLFTLDADLTTRLADARLARAGDNHGEPWWREYIRYERFDGYGGETAARRLSLALLLLSVAAWLTRRRGVQTGVLTLAARSVAVALVLLAFVPSKWPWHFGGLAAIGAVAAGAEVARLARDPVSGARQAVRPIAALALILGVTLWAWGARARWSVLDLQEFSWSDGFNAYPLLIVAPAIGVAAAIVADMCRTGAARHIGRRLHASAGWAVAAASFVVVGITAAILVIDAAISPWSPARQNIEALAGGGSCGLGHQLGAERDLVALLSEPEAPTLLEPSVGVYFPCTTIPAINGGLLEIPRYVIFEWRAWMLFERDGPFAAVADLYRVQTIARGPEALEVYAVGGTIPGFARLDAVRPD